MGLDSYWQTRITKGQNARATILNYARLEMFFARLHQIANALDYRLLDRFPWIVHRSIPHIRTC